MFEIPDFSMPGVWVSLFTLTFLEIVLGIDNLIFISIITDKMPAEKQRRARNIGLFLAMGFRLCLLLAINWIIGLKKIIFEIPAISGLQETPIGISYKDAILILGGLFLIFKSTLELHNKMNKKTIEEEKKSDKKSRVFLAVLVQIVLVDAVFSFDSILTAVGLVDEVLVMMIAVVISILVMMLFAGKLAKAISANPTLQILALSFLVVIGVVLIADGFHQEISKSIIYSCLCFSLVVELLNIRFRKAQEVNKK